jgi:hypothetical protein
MKYNVGDVFVVKNIPGLDGLKVTIVEIGEDNIYTLHYSDDFPGKVYYGYGESWFENYTTPDETTIAKKILKSYEV